MSQDRFVAAYVINVSDVAHELPEKLEELGIKGIVQDDDGYVTQLEDPFRIVYGTNFLNEEQIVLQVVVANEEFEGSMEMAFNHGIGQVVITTVRDKYPELFKFITRYGRFDMYPVAYVYNTSSDEPIVL